MVDSAEIVLLNRIVRCVWSERHLNETELKWRPTHVMFPSSSSIRTGRVDKMCHPQLDRWNRETSASEGRGHARQVLPHTHDGEDWQLLVLLETRCLLRQKKNNLLRNVMESCKAAAGCSKVGGWLSEAIGQAAECRRTASRGGVNRMHTGPSPQLHRVLSTAYSVDSARLSPSCFFCVMWLFESIEPGDSSE